MKKYLLFFFITVLQFSYSALYAQWSAAIPLTTMAVSASLNENMGSCLAVNGDTVHVVWCDHRANGNSIWYKRSVNDGITWNMEVPITDTAGKATYPAIAVSGNYVHVVW